MLALPCRSELRRQVRYQYPIPQVQCFEIHQATIPMFPSAGDNITLQAGKLRVDVTNFGERGNALANGGVQVRTWSFPIRTEKPVATILRNGDDYRFEWSKYILVACDAWKNVSVDEQFRKIVKQPEIRADIKIVREDHDPGPRYSSALRQASGLIFPMVDGQNAEDCVETVIAEWERLGASLNHRGCTYRTLRDHCARRFDRYDKLRRRLV